MNTNKIKFIVFVLIFFFTTLFAQNKTYTTTNGKFELNIPQSWNEIALNDEAEIQLGNEKEEQYFILLSEGKADLYGWNIQKHSFITLGSLLASLDSPVVYGPEELEINGNKAVRFQIEGSTQGLKIVYIHTTIETAYSFNQILAWTLKSKFESNKDTLKSVTDSFSEKLTQ